MDRQRHSCQLKHTTHITTIDDTGIQLQRTGTQASNTDVNKRRLLVEWSGVYNAYGYPTNRWLSLLLLLFTVIVIVPFLLSMPLWPVFYPGTYEGIKPQNLLGRGKLFDTLDDWILCTGSLPQHTASPNKFLSMVFFLNLSLNK